LSRRPPGRGHSRNALGTIIRGSITDDRSMRLRPDRSNGPARDSGVPVGESTCSGSIRARCAVAGVRTRSGSRFTSTTTSPWTSAIWNASTPKKSGGAWPSCSTRRSPTSSSRGSPSRSGSRNGSGARSASTRWASSGVALCATRRPSETIVSRRGLPATW